LSGRVQQRIGLPFEMYLILEMGCSVGRFETSRAGGEGQASTNPAADRHPTFLH